MWDANGSGMSGSRSSAAHLGGRLPQLRWQALCAASLDRDRDSNCCPLVGGAQFEVSAKFFHSLVHPSQAHSIAEIQD
jgi:hypothetical protein